ncbi:LysE family translocator [Marinomonas sp. 2405UD68-3]|uniref:LysE family translocator n=1 Tax=Marinomonas sp. 2405UD68-3 TaxID=3391835 RepID=UPI0039C9EDD3
MFNIELFVLFVIASLTLAFSPGPAMMYVFSRTISGGKKAGIVSTLGASIGGLCHVFFAGVGLSLLVVETPWILIVFKYIGAAYLLYLGGTMFMKSKKLMSSKPKVEDILDLKSVFFQGILAELLNPKTALFILAFIPQFISNPETHYVSKFLLYGFLVVLFNSIPDFIIAFFAGPSLGKLMKKEKFFLVQNIISGMILISLSIVMVLT